MIGRNWWVIAALLLACVVLFSYSQFRAEEITVEPSPTDLPDSFILPCQMAYGDDITDASDRRRINVSLWAGQAGNPDEAVTIIRKNRIILKTTYEELTEGRALSQSLFLEWADRLFVKHRGEKEKYQRSGWYLTALDDEGGVMGDFFLSDEGVLMPVSRICQRSECCV
jgi:hypothetical protein